MCNKNIVIPGSVLSVVSDIYWGFWKLSPMNKGGLLYKISIAAKFVT